MPPNEVFEVLENDRKSGTLEHSVTSSAVRYLASLEHSGYMEQVHPDGNESHAINGLVPMV
jgi:hypothetical protein